MFVIISRHFVLWSALAIAVAPALASPQLADGDFQQLMRTAVAVSAQRSEVQPSTTTICVRRELDPALTFSPEAGKTLPGLQQTPIGVAAEQSMVAAMAKAVPARQTRMPPLPAKFVMVSKGKAPVDCVVEHVPALPGTPRIGNDAAVVLSFTRPALANNYAFIEEYEDCPGLCGTTFLRVFRKQHGKWMQVARTIMSVS